MSERQANRTSRLLEIERLLLGSPEGLSANELAEKLAVDRRTIYRDIEFLCEQEIPVWQENGRFGINRTHYISNVRLTFHEAIALVLAGLLLSRTIDERNPHVSTALRKLAAHLANPLNTHLERAAERVQAHGDSQSQVRALEVVAEGWGTGQKVKISYRSRNSTVRHRIISPYALEPTPSGIYVIAHDDVSNEIRTFKLERMENVSVLSESFSVPDGFNVESHLAGGWRIMSGGGEMTEVVLQFKPSVTAQVKERQWHATQKLEITADGGCLLRVQVAQPVEMQPWIQTWGAQAEVLSPQWLRDQVATEMRQAAEQYTVDSGQYPVNSEQ